MNELSKLADSLADRIAKRCARGVLSYRMISPGDRVLLAVSGGKDSLTLAYAFTRLVKSLGMPFELAAVHVQGDFPGCAKTPAMESLLADWGIPFTVLPVAIAGRLKEGRELNCYWCSTQRRMELLKYADEHGFTSIALGHHRDDILETLFMNMAYKGEMSTMLPVMQYRKFPQKMIRPLCLVGENEIVEFAKEMGFLSSAAVCPYGATSNRLEARKAIELLASKGNWVKDNLWKAMENVNPEYLP